MKYFLAYRKLAYHRERERVFRSMIHINTRGVWYGTVKNSSLASNVLEDEFNPCISCGSHQEKRKLT